MSTDGPRTLQQCWPAIAEHTRRLRRRPLLHNLRSLLQRIPFRPLDVNCLDFLEYTGIPPQSAGFLRGQAEIRTATLDDLDGLLKCQYKPLAFRSRFQAREHCAVAVLDGRIIGYQWFSDKPFHVEERYSCKLEVPPDAIYEYDIFIVPEYRLAGLWFKFHCLYLAELMRKLHRRRVIGMVEYGQRLTLNTHLRFGFRPFRRVVVVKLFGKSLSMAIALRSEPAPSPRWSACADGAARAPEPTASAPLAALGSVHTETP